tara:strand:- start:247 stop:459 length:213 start_codon:yes stop_codon:yes gene_type:complete
MLVGDNMEDRNKIQVTWNKPARLEQQRPKQTGGEVKGQKKTEQHLTWKKYVNNKRVGNFTLEIGGLDEGN